MSRKVIIAGNWKMNKTGAEGRALVEELLGKVASFDPAEILNSMESTEEVVPEVAGLVYVITDDEGNQTAPNTYVKVSADVKEHPEGNTPDLSPRKSRRLSKRQGLPTRIWR